MGAGDCLQSSGWSRGTHSPTSGGTKQECEIEEVLFHPNYDLNAKKAEGIPEFYDYDVALIKLKKKLKYSETIR